MAAEIHREDLYGTGIVVMVTCISLWTYGLLLMEATLTFARAMRTGIGVGYHERARVQRGCEEPSLTLS